MIYFTDIAAGGKDSFSPYLRTQKFPYQIKYPAAFAFADTYNQ